MGKNLLDGSQVSGQLMLIFSLPLDHSVLNCECLFLCARFEPGFVEKGGVLIE